MVKVKHSMDAVEAEDGRRIWVEPLGLTRDVCQWCEIHQALPQMGPPRELWALVRGT